MALVKKIIGKATVGNDHQFYTITFQPRPEPSAIGISTLDSKQHLVFAVGDWPQLRNAIDQLIEEANA